MNCFVALLVFIFSAFLQVYSHESTEESKVWTVDGSLVLPSVFILPSPKTELPSSLDCNDPVIDSPHGQDLLFYCFLCYHYSHRVESLSSDDQREVQVGLFYLPLLGAHDPLSPSAWKKVDAFIGDLFWNHSATHMTYFTLDKMFCVDPSPLETMSLHQKDSLLHAQDIHHFRSDEMLTPNGRDVFIPHVINKSDIGLASSASEERQFVLLAALRESSGLGDRYRMYHTRLYSHLQSMSLHRALISNNMSETEVNDALGSAQFCFVLPGDTSSATSLTEAILRGCIPVIFVTYPAQLPFYEWINWSSFSLIFYKDEINFPLEIDRIVQTVYDLSRDEIKVTQMRDALARHAVLFDYGRREWPSVYHLSLLSLQEKLQRGKDLLVSDVKMR